MASGAVVPLVSSIRRVGGDGWKKRERRNGKQEAY